MNEVREIVEKVNEALDRAKKYYSRTVMIGLAGPKEEYRLRIYASDSWPYNFTGEIKCIDEACEAQVFVGWPTGEIRKAMDEYARIHKECEALHERLIENGSVLSCKVGVDKAFESLVDIFNVVSRVMKR